ncbi:MAG TPA: FAD-dependent monooxygenase [Burkholderiales bacterium]|jgi:2-polyprenyl-6-methoxyphenol hydroxylase-like FAD-dependent oxidoreductase
MKVLVVGAGPAGLYFSYLFKKASPGCALRVVEQNPPGATFGFGVVFSDRALEFLRGDDPGTYDAITPHMEAWTDLTVVHRGTPVVIDGIGFSAIGRLQFLRLMQQRAASVGIAPEYSKAISSDRELEGFDLVVAADGANSFVRRTADFGTTITPLANKFAWFGTTKIFPTLTQTFVENEHGTFNAHHYRHARDLSTFVFECDAATWQRAGFSRMDEPTTLEYCERTFAESLGGHRLVSNKSVWRNFPNVRSRRWWAGNVVLIGDALRTAHFSIGSGTRLAMEDAIALVKALDGADRIEKALESFEAARRPIVEKLVVAADASGNWYDRFPEHMRLAPREFAWSYIQRSGRIDPRRLRKISPKFVDG